MSAAGESREATPRRGQPVAEKISPWPFVGMAGMACTFFLNAASGLLVPPWAVAVLLALWGGLLLLGFRWWTPHPRRVALLPVVSVLLWFGLVNLGALLFHWTA
ncbi:hypothetical protein GCM10011584_29460 [Nocardioides phosphati]|uniref:DUF4175 domain-containing protein n=1 Tax=Nocardioides phosphati TaxID=1867775 RepID=A0ABQ2NCD5_9ACTN|nr:hypothetical protein [Nocardioides phosphati]GGO92629.1 hypothetical protein GCM10011584_29460 [Nocardioides phosphati]